MNTSDPDNPESTTIKCNYSTEDNFNNMKTIIVHMTATNLSILKHQASQKSWEIKSITPVARWIFSNCLIRSMA